MGTREYEYSRRHRPGKTQAEIRGELSEGGIPITHEETMEFIRRRGNNLLDHADDGDEGAAKVLEIGQIYQRTRESGDLARLQKAIAAYAGREDWNNA